MNPSPELNTILRQLRLSGILDSLEQRNREAIDGQLAYTEFYFTHTFWPDFDAFCIREIFFALWHSLRFRHQRKPSMFDG